MKTQNEIRRKNITEQIWLNRLRNEKNNVDISIFFENEIIREQRKFKKLQTESNISNFFEDEVFRNQRKLNKLQNEINKTRFFENDNIREQWRLNKLQNEINITRFFENDNIREQRRLNKLQNEINIDIRKNGFCKICNTNVHKSSITKYLRSIKHQENQLIIPYNFFNENLSSSSKISTKKYNPLKLSDLARDKIKLNDRELNKEIVEKMLNPYYFKNKNLYNILKINLDSHHVNHLNSKLTISSTTEYNSIDMDFKNILVKEMSNIFTRLINSFKFKYQTVLLAKFDKQGEFGEILDETDLFINLKNNQNLTEIRFLKK